MPPLGEDSLALELVGVRLELVAVRIVIPPDLGGTGMMRHHGTILPALSGSNSRAFPAPQYPKRSAVLLGSGERDVAGISLPAL